MRRDQVRPRSGATAVRFGIPDRRPRMFGQHPGVLHLQLINTKLQPPFHSTHLMSHFTLKSPPCSFLHTRISFKPNVKETLCIWQINGRKYFITLFFSVFSVLTS